MMKLFVTFSTTLSLFGLLAPAGVSAQEQPQLRSPTAGDDVHLSLSSAAGETTTVASNHLRVRGHVDGGMSGLRTNNHHSGGYRDLVEALPFSQCNSQQGPFGVDGNCLKLPDIQNENVGVLEVSFVQDGTDGQAQSISSDVLEPIQTILNIIASSGPDGKPISPFQFCFGDFEGAEVANGTTTTLCQSMPLRKDAEWSIFAFSVTIPKESTELVCGAPDAKDKELQACIAVSECDGLPSVAFGVNKGMISCIVGQAGVATGGLATAAAKAIDLGLETVSTGYSATNAFELEINIYNGRKLLRYKNNPTWFDQIQIGFDLDKLGLKNFTNYFALTGTLTRGTTINANPNFSGSLEETVEEILAAFDGSGEDIIYGFVEKIEELGISVETVAEATLTGIFKMKEIPVIGSIFPNLAVEAFEANTYMYLGTEPRDIEIAGNTERVYPGVSFFAGTSLAANFIKTFVEFLGKSIGAILNLLPSWSPIDLDFADILSKLNLGEISADDAFGAGATFNTDRTGFLINVPLLIDELGKIQVNCYTDYEKFNCEVKTNLEDFFAFFTGAVQELEDAALWVARLTDETFQEAGQVVAAAFVDAGSAIEEAFSEESLKNTGKMIADGVLDLVDYDLSATEAAVVGALMNTVLQAEEVLGPIVSDGVKEIAEFGEGLVNVAEKAFDDAKQVVDDALDLAGSAFDCAGSALMYSGGGSLSSSCTDFNELGNTLKEFGNVIGKALEQAWDDVADFFGGIGSLFGSTRYQYNYIEPAKYGKYNCRVMEIIRVRKRLFKKTRRTKVGETVDGTCLENRLKQINTINLDVAKADMAFENFERVQNENLDALTGVNYSTDPSTFACSTRWIRGDVTDAGVPLEVTCSTPQILADGTQSTETLSTTDSLRIQMDTDSYNSIPIIIESLTSKVRLALVEIITSTMTKAPNSCEPRAGPAGDGIDNDCNGLVDDSILCDYEDHIPGDITQFWKDCKCAPPILDPIADVTVACNADYTPIGIGAPAVTLSSSGDVACPASGGFLGELDTTNVLNTCGDAVITRIHQYADGLSQLSNRVTQTVTLTKVPPELNETLVEKVIFVDSTVEVKESIDEISFLAPDAEVPEDLGVSVCASVLDEYYLDLSIDYVGCPENPEDVPSGKFKGWNVERQWVVEDECEEKDTYIQTVVRTDEVAPTLDMPLVRVQSCRASYDPINTGYPVANDQSDPFDVLNPSDWSVLPLADGRISYSDSGDLLGCEQDFVREFVVNDRVCNEFSDSHVIQSSPFDFRPTAESSTEYDPSSLLPTFEFDVAGASRQVHEDIVKYNFNPNAETFVDGCLEGSVEYLDTTRQDAVWTEISYDFARGVFKIDDGFNFSIQLNEDRRFVYERIINESVGGEGVFRMSLSCRSKSQNGNGNGNGPRDLEGSIMFKLKII